MRQFTLDTVTLFVFMPLWANTAQKLQHYELAMFNTTNSTVVFSLNSSIHDNKSSEIAVGSRNVEKRKDGLIIDAFVLKYMYVYVVLLYLSVVILIVVLDGAMPRLCGKGAVISSMRSAEITHSVYEGPRPAVHNIPPGYDTVPVSPILPLHNNEFQESALQSRK